ncbi:carbon-monoxide dehydrogenase medium subunit/xanthine dehydrogenase FAD-binding subunit [Halanaerobium saccharolyticum]|uniref:Carbon-monoxide dehydrogenase medium subunit/xanthine dehydrogenase FAD-binding subunit n=1 Tax=Halanaerobium saccharolyticum TaxID=43595 RepID=A0A2T5RQG0_9FIRM|nr:xanthine dehydrogenase family protein subunit M [Halanaerobium saccharolyticum]PTW02216.1 carbon-monoxide dehydrogenase medium subunit/xanthine dehydrogenase FAD-binding subunit [Halanaerobium saccharolyticum]PUU95614.1 MAG: xanthine dehydrogenase FAD-binding subunit [Halanaerobium sp.]
MVEYQLLRAHSLDELLEILDQRENVQLLAGGTDLMVDLHHQDQKFDKIDYLLDITAVDELKGIQLGDKKGEIGALTTHAELVSNPEIKEKLPFIAAAASSIGSTQIRNRATIGGNLANAAACADSFSPLIALGAEVVLRSKGGARRVLLEDFVEWPYQTIIKPDEVLEKIVFAMPQGEYYSSYQKIGRRKALSISRISLTLLAEVENGRVKKAQVASGAATPFPVPFRKVNDYLNGKSFAEIDPIEAGNIAADEMVGITGERWSTPYKRPALGKLVERAVEDLLEEAGYNG